MKTRIITLLLAISAIIIGGATAQEYDRKVDLYKNGAVLESYDITDVDSIKFRRIDYVKAEYKVLPSGTGNVTIDGSTTTPKYVVPGTNVTYVATAKSGYKFKGWNMEGVEISTSNTLILPINSNTEITAVFQNIPNYSVTVVSSGNGTVSSSSSSVQEGGSVTLTATPNSGYVFKNWTLNGNVVSTQNPYTATVTSNSVYVANFEKTYTISVSSGEGGTAVASKSSVQEGGSVTLTATPNEGYSFVNWTVEGVEVSTQNPYTATVTANSVYVANFKVAEEYRIKDLGTGYYLNAGNYTAHTDGPVGGVNLVAYAESDDQIFTFTQSGSNYILTTKSGYNIVCQRWNVDALTSAGTALTFVDNGNGTYYIMNGSDYFKVEKVDGVYYPYCNAPSYMKATWILEQVGEDVTYTISVSSGEGGTATTSSNSVVYGGKVILKATPNEGYKFVKWTVNGEVVSTENPYTATITANTEFKANFKATKGVENSHEWIDLGLPSGIKWATCNVGANSPEEYGDYFAWGETAPKTTYNWSNYKYCKGDAYTMTKYCQYSYYGTVDYKTVLELEDDAARINWGGNWRMPTKEELDELRDTNNCTWEWTTQNGVNGYKVTSNINGNSIFLPAPGWRDDDNHYSAGTGGEYQSSSLSMSNSYYVLGFDSSHVSLDPLYRYYGFSVRAVYTPIPTHTITVSSSNETMGSVAASATEVEDGSTVTLTATPKEGYKFVYWTVNGAIVSTENPYTATITANKEFVANFVNSLSDSDSNATENGHAYVDLGLPSGIKWATCNVGANSPEEYGDYFAWGETAPKATYDYNTYKYCNGSYDTMTKYCTNSEYGTVDNKTVLELEDDAARVNWGGKWRMPTGGDLSELKNTDNCTWEWTTQNGVNGYKVTSKVNGNSIFLPAAGGRYYDYLTSAGSYGTYWSSSLDGNRSDYAWNNLNFHLSYVGLDNDSRFEGYPVRAVLPTHTITVSSSNETMGSVAASATEVEDGSTVTLTATPKEGYKFAYWTVNGAIVSTENPYTATITANKEFVANFVNSLSYSNGTENGYEYVDLGLPSGIKWATCNVGANSPEEYGDYFAWGETAPKTTYNWSNYKYCNGTYNSLTKYCTKSSHGTVDNKTTLELSDDAAYVNWGGNWRMPTVEEINELMDINNCIWEWTTKNGVNGFKVTSKRNGNSIFLPAAGWYGDLFHDDGNSLLNSTEAGSYWSNSIIPTSYNSEAWDFFFWRSSGVNSNGYYRCWGSSVRAVCE